MSAFLWNFFQTIFHFSFLLTEAPKQLKYKLQSGSKIRVIGRKRFLQCVKHT